jgi:hypothetical protein
LCEGRAAQPQSAENKTDPYLCETGSAESETSKKKQYNKKLNISKACPVGNGGWQYLNTSTSYNHFRKLAYT